MGFRSLRSRVRKLETTQSSSPDVPQSADWLPNTEERENLYQDLIEHYAKRDFPETGTVIIVLLWNDKMVEDFAEDVLDRIADLPPEMAEPIKRKLLEHIGE